MSEVLTLKRDKYVYAADLEDLSDYLERTFIIRKNGVVKAVKLVKVRNTKVHLEHMGDRVDSFSISINEFRKYYELPQKS